MAVGDPHERPEEETVFIPNSYGIARDWESYALVPWALHLPRDAGARDIEALIIRELQIEPRDVSVTLHQPESYIVRFEHAAHAAAAKDKGRFAGRGIDICLRPWRSLTHALGFRIFYRVRLCLDGVPDHVWTPEIVERIIGGRCALQHIVTDLVQPVDTRHIELWAWSRDPGRIPKKIWLTFTHRPIDGSSAVFVDTEPPPDRWHQGVRYEVFIHIPLIEDYSAAADNLQEAIDNPAAYALIRRRYDWRYGLVDGAPATARATRFPARLPRPPPGRDMQEARGGRAQHAALDSRPRREARGSSDSRGRGTEDHHSNRGGRDEHDPRAKGGDHRNDCGEREPQRRKDDKGRRASCRGYSSSYREGFTWPSARDGDNSDDDYDHPGLGKLSSASF
jgi:hypothetical protein